MWNPGCMLMPWVVTYVVPPPSVAGQKSHTAASTSAATALMLAALVAAFMVKAPLRVRRGGRRAAPPVPRRGYWTTVRPTLSKSAKLRGVPLVSQVMTMTVVSQAVFTVHAYGVPTDDGAAELRVMVDVLPVRFVVEVNSTASTIGAVRGVRDVVDVGRGQHR